MGFLRHSRALRQAVDILAENRLVPRRILERRETTRRRFLATHVQPGGIGAEIGVQKGFFTHAILRTVEPQRLHLVDPWYLLGEKWDWATTNQSTTTALRNIIHWFRKELARGDVVIHIGFAARVLADFPDNYFDWVYLDTSHSYEDTLEELKVLGSKVKENGIILGDDWFSAPGHKFYGQYRAINEFVSGSDYRIVASSDADHQWALKRAKR